MRRYLELSIRGYRRYSSYRSAVIAGLFTNLVFGALRTAIMYAVFAHSRHVGGYSLNQAIMYVWLAQGLMTIVQMYGNPEFAMRVRTGAIATELTRPIDTQGAAYATDLGRATYHSIFRGVIPVAVGVLAFSLPLPSAANWLEFAVSLWLAATVSFMLLFAYSLSAFWLLDYRGVALVAVILMNLLSGFVIPVSFFPPWLRTVAMWTPFPSIIQTPVNIFTGDLVGAAALRALAAQALWALTLLLLGRALFSLGRRRLVIQGG
ncbi:MAG TPA: ABC-2 family transporter protein [Streptosporangiaceae bacterium]|nr:ABC-2 family transporter protein [Streptosporangiaceae bacterium]